MTKVSFFLFFVLIVASARGLGFNHLRHSSNDLDLEGENVAMADAVQDLQAKYEAAVNKAESVAASALRTADAALHQQETGQRHDLDEEAMFRYKREAEEEAEIESDRVKVGQSGEENAQKNAAKIPPEKIDKMIDLMNSLNQQFGNFLHV